jgi:hypothetical protein
MQADNAPGETAFVDFDQVWLAYNDDLLAKNTFAVEDINLKVRQGEFIAIVGPSGCGKSTFMKLTTGLKMPSMGKIPSTASRSPGPLKISGMAFQAPSLLPWRTTLDNVLLPLEIVEPYRSQFKDRRKEFEDRRQAPAGQCGPRWHGIQVPVGAVRWHAAAREHLPRADPRTQDAAAGRALRRARRLHPRGAVVHAARPVGRAAIQRHPGHARPARIGLSGRHGLLHEQAAPAASWSSARSRSRAPATWR